MPYLLKRGIKKLDYIVISHFDTDHVEGILVVMKEIKVGTVIISKQGTNSANYEKFKDVVKKKKIKVMVVGNIEKDIEKVKIEEDVYLEIFWPNNEKMVEENILNNNSIVCKLKYRSSSTLFTGDIEEIAEEKILKKYESNLRILNSTILKVGHHGSKTSSTEEFIKAVSPRLALIGVGKNNKFGHPDNEVITRLMEMNTKIYRTDQMGEITITIDKKGGIKVNKYVR